MMLTNKETNHSIEHVTSLPLILALNAGGEPMDWITYEDSAYYAAKKKVLWSIGSYEVVLRGGTNAKTGKQSTLTFDSILALNYDRSPTKYRRASPSLSNTTLFERDRNLCAYCSNVGRPKNLTRDHVVPTSRGGKDSWENCVTACYGCNQYKGDKTLEEAEMKLIYVPYVPSFHEHMILKNRKILSDQMDFLLKGVPKHSRLHAHRN